MRAASGPRFDSRFILSICRFPAAMPSPADGWLRTDGCATDHGATIRYPAAGQSARLRGIHMAEAPIIRGSCLCEAVRFEVVPPTKWCAHCHCTMCRRAHGAGMVTWFGVHRSSFQLLAGAERLKWYQSSAAARRGFCSNCGTPMFFEGERWPDEIHIARATVAGTIDREPSVHVFYDARSRWLEGHDQLKKLGGPSGFEPLTEIASA